MGQSLQANGTLALPGAAQGTPKSAAYKGSVVLNGQTIEGSIEATLDGPAQHHGRPQGERARPRQDRRRSAPRRARRRAASRPPRPGRSTRRRCAASTAASSSRPATLISPPLRLGNADIAATLKDGVLTVTHFKGALYGGSLNLSGVVNASQPALAYDFKGDASGINLGEMLRSTAGTNQFGGTIKVTIDGRLNASGIALRGGGVDVRASSRASMAGGAQLERPHLRRRRQGAADAGLGRDRRGGRRDRQHAGQRAGHRRPGQCDRRRQHAERGLPGAEPLRQSRQPDLGPGRHRGRRADRQGRWSCRATAPRPTSPPAPISSAPRPIPRSTS